MDTGGLVKRIGDAGKKLKDASAPVRLERLDSGAEGT
jgi:hypothetical protein